MYSRFVAKTLVHKSTMHMELMEERRKILKHHWANKGEKSVILAQTLISNLVTTNFAEFINSPISQNKSSPIIYHFPVGCLFCLSALHTGSFKIKLN